MIFYITFTLVLLGLNKRSSSGKFITFLNSVCCARCGCLQKGDTDRKKIKISKNLKIDFTNKYMSMWYVIKGLRIKSVANIYEAAGELF